jgi:hypothetical protein
MLKIYRNNSKSSQRSNSIAVDERSLMSIDMKQIKRNQKLSEKQLETIILKIPDSETDEKNENSESEETQKQDTIRESR